MKRILYIVITMIFIFTAATSCADVSRKDFAEQLEETSIILMKSYRDYYEKNPEKFTDAHLVAMYSYYKMYKTASDIYVAESSIGLGKAGESLIDKEAMRLSWNTSTLIELKWNEWISGEYERDKMIQFIIAFIDGAIETHDEKGQ